MTSLMGPVSSCTVGGKTTGAIITGLPTSFHCAASRLRDSFSHAICLLPVMVRSGSLIAGSGEGTGVCASATCSLR